ncbi:hypothetical protein LUR56_08255 [Streptomyces sp. MT29]|nr:hypothetical protein [Streptomyces sp. MT29]
MLTHHRRVQRHHHRPGLGQFAQRGPHHPRVGGAEQPDQRPAHDSRGEEAGVQSGTGQAQRLVLEDGVPSGGKPGDEPLGVVRVQDSGGADGLVEELSGRFRGEEGGIGAQFGPQPGDLYASGPPGRTPVGQRPAGPVRLGPQPPVELRQGEGLLRRRPRGLGQQTDEQLLLTGTGVGAGNATGAGFRTGGGRGTRTLGEKGETEMAYAGAGVADQSAEQLRGAGPGVEVPGEEAGVGAGEGGLDELLRRCGHPGIVGTGPVGRPGQVRGLVPPRLLLADDVRPPGPPPTAEHRPSVNRREGL